MGANAMAHILLVWEYYFPVSALNFGALLVQHCWSDHIPACTAIGNSMLVFFSLITQTEFQKLERRV